MMIMMVLIDKPYLMPLTVMSIDKLQIVDKMMMLS